MANDEVVGQLTAGVDSPTLGCGIGYVVFNEAGDWNDLHFSVRLPGGNTHACEIMNLPFFNPGKLIVRGLDRTIPDLPDR